MNKETNNLTIGVNLIISKDTAEVDLYLDGVRYTITKYTWGDRGHGTIHGKGGYDTRSVLSKFLEKHDINDEAVKDELYDAIDDIDSNVTNIMRLLSAGAEESEGGLIDDDEYNY